MKTPMITHIGRRAESKTLVAFEDEDAALAWARDSTDRIVWPVVGKVLLGTPKVAVPIPVTHVFEDYVEMAEAPIPDVPADYCPIAMTPCSSVVNARGGCDVSGGTRSCPKEDAR